MENGKGDLIKRLIHSEVLSFEERILKSGRKSPYFFNIGKAGTALKMSSLARGYASLISQDTDIIVGPAYKGIVLSYAVALEFSRMNRGMDMGYAFNRKEAKKEEGIWIGDKIENGLTLSMVDDVITDGATKYELRDLIKDTVQVEIPELIIAFNRQEVDANGNDAVAEFKVKTGIDVKSVLTLSDAFDYLVEQKMEREADSIRKYVGEYGTREAKGHILRAA